MSQVLGGESCLFNPGFQLLIEFIEAAAEGAVGLGKLGQYCSQTGPEDAGVGTRKEPCGA